jgi:hypothetical protein
VQKYLGISEVLDDVVGVVSIRRDVDTSMALKECKSTCNDVSTIDITQAPRLRHGHVHHCGSKDTTTTTTTMTTMTDIARAVTEQVTDRPSVPSTRCSRLASA